MDHRPFVDAVRALVEASPHFDASRLEAALVINPRAGGFSHAKRLAESVAAAEAAVAAARGRDQAADGAASGAKPGWRVRYTEAPRHAARIAAEFLDEAAMRQGREWLAVLASGDGTSHEFLDALSRAPEELRARFTVLRLPMGTGNDGSDGRMMGEALGRLGAGGKPAWQAALRVIPAPGGPAALAAPEGEWRSFNIASVGLDAFVTNQTNKLKAGLPGDFYKLWLDVASLLYDFIYPTRDMAIRALGADGAELGRYEGRFLLAAMGVSGRRTYGANKPILPDDDNVCAVRQMPLLRKLALKGPIAAGQHRKFPEALLFSAEALEIRYAAPILVQMDGEAHPLTPEDFPLRMERTGPAIRHLARA